MTEDTTEDTKTVPEIPTSRIIFLGIGIILLTAANIGLFVLVVWLCGLALKAIGVL